MKQEIRIENIIMEQLPKQEVCPGSVSNVAGIIRIATGKSRHWTLQ